MGTIIKREFLDYIQSLQFLILLIISVILFALAGWISIKKYNEEIVTYNRNVTEIRNAPSTMGTHCYRQPNALRFITDGGLSKEPDGVRLLPKGSQMTGSFGETNFKMPDIPDLDWSFIIKVVFSLYVILLGFNSISGEKEQGTLRMIVSNSIGRGQILMGKYFSIILAVMVPLLLGALISFLLVTLSIPNVISLNILARLLLLLVISLVYFSGFTLFSLLISSVIKRSSIVLLVLLAHWILFIFIVPNLSGILSVRFSKIPSERQTAKQMGPMIQKEVWDRINQIRERATQGEFQTKEEILAETDRAFEEAQSKVRGYYVNFRNAMKKRSDLARTLSRSSPSAQFQYALEGIANSGPKRQEQFMEDIETYSTIYDDYIRSKSGKVVGTSPWSFSTGMMFKGEYVNIRSPQPEEYQGDKSDFPHFTESRPSIGRNLRSALFDLAGLLIWNLGLAIMAIVAFFKCDVR